MEFSRINKHGLGFGTYYDFPGVSIAREFAWEFSNSCFYRRPLIICSAPGNGKSHLAFAIYIQIVLSNPILSNIFFYDEDEPEKLSRIINGDWGRVDGIIFDCNNQASLSKDSALHLSKLIDFLVQKNRPVVITELLSSGSSCDKYKIGRHDCDRIVLFPPSKEDINDLYMRVARNEGLEISESCIARLVTTCDPKNMQAAIDYLRSFISWLAFFNHLPTTNAVDEWKKMVVMRNRW